MGLGLVRVVPGWVSVGRGALFQCTNAFWGLNKRSQGGWPRLEPRVGALDRGGIRRMPPYLGVTPLALVREQPLGSAAVLGHVARADDVLGQDLELGALPPHLGVGRRRRERRLRRRRRERLSKANGSLPLIFLGVAASADEGGDRGRGVRQERR